MYYCSEYTEKIIGGRKARGTSSRATKCGRFKAPRRKRKLVIVAMEAGVD
jgi:hypothetical protein